MGKFLGGLLLGALVGGVAAMMLAPQSGKSLQETLRGRWEEVMDEGRRAAADRRAELEAQFAEARRPARPA